MLSSHTRLVAEQIEISTSLSQAEAQIADMKSKEWVQVELLVLLSNSDSGISVRSHLCRRMHEIQDELHCTVQRDQEIQDCKDSEIAALHDQIDALHQQTRLYQAELLRLRTELGQILVEKCSDA